MAKGRDITHLIASLRTQREARYEAGPSEKPCPGSLETDYGPKCDLHQFWGWVGLGKEVILWEPKNKNPVISLRIHTGS